MKKSWLQFSFFSHIIIYNIILPPFYF